MKAGILGLAAALVAASTPLGAANLYEWKDGQGRKVYSDLAPPIDARNAQQKRFTGSVIEGGESYATKTAREKHPITLYANACGIPCDQARQLLAERGVPFSSKDPQASPEAQAELQKLTGRLSVPVLVVGTERVDGFESGRWHTALDQAGYPSSATPGRKPAPPAAPVAPAAPAPAE